MASKNNRTGGDVNEIALAYLEEKYGEPFTYAGATGNSMSGTHAFYADCESLPGKHVKVAVVGFQASDYTVRDNYLLLKYEEEIRQYLLEQAQTEFSDVRLHYYETKVTLSEDLPADATLEQVLHDPEAYVSAVFEVRADAMTEPSGAARVAERVAADLKQYDVEFLAVEDDRFGTMTDEEADECISRGTYVRYASYVCLHDQVQTQWKEAGD